MKENYSIMCEDILNNLNGKKKLLLHSCCGPCSSYVISYLTNYFDITILYYNPNIYPYDEYLKRKEEQIKLIKEIDKSNNVDILDCDYDNENYEELIKGLEKEPERGKRCYVCYRMRMEKTASTAKDNGYDYFCTTFSGLFPFSKQKKTDESPERSTGCKYGEYCKNDIPEPYVP